MSKILRVNMTDLTTKFEDVPEKYRLTGGRGLTSAITCAEVPPTCHPLGPNNKITFAPGIVTATGAPTAGRLSVGGKAPLTGTIKETNAGGMAADKLARLDIKAIIVEGQPKEKGKFWLLKVDKDGASSCPPMSGRAKDCMKPTPSSLPSSARMWASSASALPERS